MGTNVPSQESVIEINEQWGILKDSIQQTSIDTKDKKLTNKAAMDDRHGIGNDGQKKNVKNGTN